MTDLVSATPKPIFTKKHELLTFLKNLKKASKRAIEVLEKGLDSEDEKVRTQCAAQLLKFYREVANDVREDEIKALLLDIRATGLIGNGSTADDDDTPSLDFENISPEFAQDVQVVDLGDVSKI